MPTVKNVGEPCAGEPHARFDGGREETSDSRPRRATPGASRLPDQPQWRDAAGQHQRVLGRAWTQRGRPPAGYLTKQLAQRELDTILADARRGQLLGPTRPAGGATFAEAAAEWLRYVEHDRKRRPSTVRDYRTVVDNVLVPALGRAPLEAITSAHVDAFRRCSWVRGGCRRAPSTSTWR